MLYRRISTDGANLDWIKELETRISNLETPALGNVAVRGLITVTDPVTGVQTQLGALPGGGTGFKQFVYDITPPPVASAPVAKAEPGVFIIGWDGLFADGSSAPPDFFCCNIIAHKIINGTTVSSTPVGMTRRPLDITFVQTDVAAINETWNFSLEAEDTNGNRAAWSARSNTVTMLPIAGEVDLTEIEADIQQAKDDAFAANQAAGAAQSAATAASEDAAEAVGLVAGKSTVLIQPTSPAVEYRLATTLWIDTNNGGNTPKRWNTTSSQWEVVTDKVATDAAAAAATANSAAGQAASAAVTAAEAAGQAQETADAKNRVWYQPDAPAGILHKTGDLWFDTDNDNKINRWNGTTNQWVESLLGNNAILANLDAGKITVGYISALVLKAKSIGVDKLMITSTDNLIQEADFGNQGLSWGVISTQTRTINATAGRGGGPAFRVTATSILQTLSNLNNRITVGTEDRFRGSFYVKSTVALAAGAVKLNMRCFSTATASTNITVASNPVLVANTYTLVEGISPVLPANTIAVEFYLEVLNPTTATITDIDYVGMTRAADSKLVVDGAIDGKVITGPYIQTDNSVDAVGTGRGLKLNPLGFKAYNALGQKTFEIAASTGIVTATGTYSSGTATEDGATGKTVRATMGIIQFQNYPPSPGLLFESHDTNNTTTTPKGVIFYYFGGIQIRSTSPTNTWSQFRNDSYVWVSQEGIQISANNSGYTEIDEAVSNKSRLEVYTRPGSVQSPANDTNTRIISYLSPSASMNDRYAHAFGIEGGTGHGSPRGDAYAGSYKFDDTGPLFHARVQSTWDADGTHIVTSYNSALDEMTEFSMYGNEPFDAWSIRGFAKKIQFVGGDTAMTDSNSGAYIQLTTAGGAYMGSETRASFIQIKGDTTSVTGKFQINGNADIKYRHAEFTTTDWFVAGNGDSWDSGPVTAAGGAWTVNNDFCVPGTANGSIRFTKQGYYSIDLMIIPRSNPGLGWTRLTHSFNNQNLAQAANDSHMYETYISVQDVWFGVNETVRSQMSYSVAHNIDCRWRITKSTLTF